MECDKNKDSCQVLKGMPMVPGGSTILSSFFNVTGMRTTV